MASELTHDGPEPRLCHLVKWPDFDGYGFNLHAEKAKTGQFIGKVDDDSPADHAGLKEGDRIIEVNGVNIANENHRQVVERIKAVPNETKLLVLDDEADRWYKERKLIVKSTLPNVKYVKTPVPRPSGGVIKEEQVIKPKAENNNATTVHTNGTSSASHSETHSLADSSSRGSTPKTLPKHDASSLSSTRSSEASSPQPPTAHAQLNGNASNGSVVVAAAHSATPPSAAKSENSKPKATAVNGDSKPTPPDSSHNAPSSAANGSKATFDAANGKKADALDAAKNGKTASDVKAPASGELNLNMSAAQMREMLANRKKNDPKKQTMDMREKYQIVQQM